MKAVYVPERRARPRRRRRPGRLIIVAAAFILFLSVARLGFEEAMGVAARHFLKLERVNYGVLEEDLPLEVFIAREEQPLIAPATGTLVPVAPPDERVPAGAVIARILPASPPRSGPEIMEVKAPFPGLVSYRTDGLEKSLRPDNLGNMPFKELKRLVELGREMTAGTRVQGGTAFGRLINNLAPLTVYAALAGFPQEWQVGKRVTLKLPGSGEEVQATITRLQDEGEQKAVLMSITGWNDPWLNPRRMEVVAVLNRYRGMVIPAASLTEGAAGEKGVYVLEGVDIKWQPVTLCGRVGDRVAVKELKEGMEVVVNPSLVRWLIR
ncbi:MAG: hypothetical protein IMW95_11190 [Moorella humiferrea]|nr:hypothetical protein [Moorella humiferrea]